MITAFRMGDALRCMLVNAPRGANLAAPTESIVRCRPLRNSAFWQQSLARNPNRVTVGDWNGMDLSSLASARVRGGIRAWEVDRLHLKASEQALDVLEQVVAAAGTCGAERVFLRVPQDSHVVDEARRAGFFAYYEEILLTGQELTGDSTDVTSNVDNLNHLGNIRRKAGPRRIDTDCSSYTASPRHSRSEWGSA